MKRHCLVLPASERWEYPEDAYSRLDFASPPYHISSSLCVARPFTNGVEWGLQTLWWAELDRLHSMTRAHPPLVRVSDASLTRPFSCERSEALGKGSGQRD